MNIRTLIATALVAVASALTATAQESMIPQLMPRPAEVSATGGTFTGRIADASVTIDGAAIKTFDYKVAGFDNEGYRLSVSPQGISITAAAEIGVIRAKQTLRQLISNGAALDFSDLAAVDAAEVTLECCEITDYPAFKIRGYMHDVGRSYISYEELKHEIDLLARFKVNMFHWHLTDYHAFRFESKTHPEVNTKFERFPDGVYTQDQCRELDQYAHDRGITIIPEIDMPGHSRQFQTATGYSMTSTQSKAILHDILGELVKCFPHAPYVHVGGDETSVTVDYVKEMTDLLHDAGKKTVCWQTYGGGTVTPKTMGIDMLTNWASSGKMVSGVPNIDMRYFYVNHFDVFADLAGAYRSLIFDSEKGNTNIGGVSIGIWNDRYLDDERQILAQNNVYATVLAMTERAWIGGAPTTKDGRTIHLKYIESCGAYLPNEGDEYDEYCDWERRFLYYRDKWLADEPIPYVRSSNVRWNITPSYDNKGNVAASFDPETPGAELTPQPGSTYATGAGQWLNHIWNSIVTGVIGSQGFNQTRYAWTYVYSPKDQEVGAQIEFRNYSRSDAGLAPKNGEWDVMGSRVWVNDNELKPTWKWTNAGVNPSAEKDLGNLNFPGREPLPVTLHEGWNKVLLKCPYINIGRDNGNRPNKWQYTFVFTTLDGRHAVEGLVYSPKKMMEGEDFTNPKYEPVYPTASNELEKYYYSLATPLRDGYYVTSSGLASVMTSLKNPSEKSYWRFEKRTDDTYDIINYSDGGYISPTASNNNPIKCVKTRPTKGWKLEPAQTDGYFIIYCGTTQLNQTKSSQQYQLYNWGYNTSVANGYNISDQGCQFLIVENEALRDISPVVGIGTVLRDDSSADVSVSTFDLQGRRVPSSAAQRPRSIYIQGRRKVMK